MSGFEPLQQTVGFVTAVTVIFLSPLLPATEMATLMLFVILRCCAVR